jgi:hypothetical protein
MINEIKMRNRKLSMELNQRKSTGRLKKMSFMTALLVPGVLLYSFTSFCLKFGVGSILLWRQQWIANDTTITDDF